MSEPQIGVEVPDSQLEVGKFYTFETTNTNFPPTQELYLHMKSSGIPQFLAGGPRPRMFNFSPTSMHYCAIDPNKTVTWRFKASNGDARSYLRKHLSTIISTLPTPASGCDPELFFEDASGNVVPAFTFLPSKKDPATGAMRSMFWDGFQGEFTPGAGSCQDGVAQSIQQYLSSLMFRLPKGVRFSPKSVVEIDPRVLDSAKTEHVGLGCTPSLNAYGLHGLEVPDPRALPIRFAGGHIHFGMKSSFNGYSDYDLRMVEAVKMMDAIVGLMSVSISEGRDDPRRRMYYGLAGEYRLPKHGIEYRTLSNSWLASPSTYHLTFTVARTAARLGAALYRNQLVSVPEADVVEAINRSDARLARELMRADKGLWMGILGYSWGEDAAETFELIQQPMDAWGVHLEDMESNWRTLGWSTSNDYPQRWGRFMELRVAARKAANLAPKAP